MCRLEDTFFENLPETESKQWPLKLIKAVPVGKNLDQVKWKFCVFILKENIERVSALDIDNDLKKQVVDVINQCLSVNLKAIENNKWDESAAEFVFEFAAESAAWSYWSGRSAAFKRYADELIRLLDKV